MVDGHIHIERGEYTYEWVNQFVNKAVEKQLDEIWLLEHCYRFEEFVPMYDSVCAYSNYPGADCCWLAILPLSRRSLVHNSNDRMAAIRLTVAREELAV